MAASLYMQHPSIHLGLKRARHLPVRQCVLWPANPPARTRINRVRCFTFRKMVRNKWEAYLGLLPVEYREGDALDELGLRRYCCLRLLLAHVDLIEKLLNYMPLEK
ncbi:DNA-directed RNA polymerases I, II, and III subunit RPABC5 [Erinaceus europaeus]|uniref:DNA-directed RNA polymerases I, II, and III subunit RPABC5 n=1 Tax=Erinaceus europaeus TaxID=9365 RepID=A0A1S3A396_ERIEU|nr:DNA-directed RNA polymerases I, II, and III subunit RPABC5 [Erinaceus europaeus]